LQNVVALARPLRVPLIRIDNIFTHYDVVERAPNGRLVYRFDKLDRVVDTVRAMGAEPYMCLGYMPEALVPGGTGIDPPQSYDEWRDLVFQTVKHYNVDRGPPIKYWEVWNEPNLNYSWTGGYPGYLQLYDSSRDGMVAADPTAWIGGPTITPLDVTAPAWLMGNEHEQGPRGRVDFLSWHSFGRTFAQIEADVKAVQEVVAAQSTFHPELIISEFSVATGGAGDTSQGHRSDGSGGGAYALAGLQAMERAGLDKGFLFELKDGEKPGVSYWGRWGILTADGKTKPAYHALLAYQQMATGQLPVQLTTPPGTGVELLAARGADGRARLLLWHAGVVTHRARITLPPDLATRLYQVTIFDSEHNNFAKQGTDRLTPSPARRGTQLDFTLEPDSFVILESR
jgi:xylan 1,4-beta-xylosidase